jgi:hypothetical protein
MIEGIPDGWRLVRIGKPKAGEYYIENHGEACEAKATTPTVLHWVFPIIEKIEKPKRYRRFANAAEAEALLGQVLRFKVNHEQNFVFIGISSHGFQIGLCHYSLQEAFDCFEKLDGTPFGVEVAE